MAEFYFDYKVEVLEDGLNVKESGLPKFYVERDYRLENVKYVMYLTFPQWDAKRGGDKEEPRFDSAVLKFDNWGIDLIVFDENAEGIDREKEKVEKPEEEITYAQYKRQGYRFLVNSDWEDYSGVGILTLKKKGVPAQTTMYFAVNFGFKNKIHYDIKGGKITFTAKKVKEQVKVRIYYSDDRYPCLDNDKRSNAFEKATLDFSQDTKYVYPVSEKNKNKKLFVSLDPEEKELDKYYLLECGANDSIFGLRRDHVRPTATEFCPFCHDPIELSASFMRSYKKGGVACNGKRIYDGNSPLKVRKDKKSKKLAKNLVYCADDLGKDGEEKVKKPNANSPFARILPENFAARDHFKIIVVGSKRSGKTTFISRLFDISGQNKNTELTAKMMVNATKKKSGSPLSIAPYSLRKLDAKDGLSVSENSWYKETAFYSKYSIDLSAGRYPEATDKMDENQADKTRDVMKYPFVLDVNKDSYVYFYDIAGEDAEQSGERLRRLMETGAVGIFYLVDGKQNESGNDRVYNRIKERLDKNPSIPVAVILTKFDTLETEFNENCHCLRSDSYDMLERKYEGSTLERNVDLSSEEIKSYLLRETINPDFGETANVKYFGVSSFSASDAVAHEDQTDTQAEINYLKHMCSAKRMELPLIWMLRQFGCII